MKDISHLRAAKDIAIKSDFINTNGKNIKIGATLYKGNKLLGSATNLRKTHPLMAHYNSFVSFERTPYLHAEIAAILDAIWNVGKEQLNGATLYIARKLNCNGWGLARPCPACMHAIYDMGIKKIVYTTEYGYAIEIIKNINLEAHYAQ